MTDEKQTKAAPRKVVTTVAAVAGTIAAIFAPVLVPWLLGAGDPSSSSAIRMISVTPLHSSYPGDTRPGVQIAVDNGGNAAAEGCFVRAYDARRYSEDPEGASVLGESKRFDLPPGGGNVATVEIYPPKPDEEASSQDGADPQEGAPVAAPLVFGVGCVGAEPA